MEIETEKHCLICGRPIVADADDNQICDACEATRDELSDNKGVDDNE